MIRYVKNPNYSWLSNFHSSPIVYKGKKYPTAEHLYQSLKTIDPEMQEQIRLSIKGRDARDFGQTVALRPGWDAKKSAIMFRVQYLKYTQNAELSKLLLDTGDEEIEENAPWDSFWGSGKDGLGKNMMGQLLMMVREMIRYPNLKGDMA
jgi:ribA/ribD-fused uncharacterized protein